MLKTEQPNADHPELDLYSDEALVKALVDDQQLAVRAVQAAAPDLARAVAAAVPRLRAGGRLVTVGAGTSGRLGVLDGTELQPTFSWPTEQVLGLIAGGRDAMFRAIEGAEDSHELGAADVDQAALGPRDVVLLIAASGTTPYVLGALQAARHSGALTVALANNPGSPLAAQADIGITLDTGPEVISGSTRLKAGTAQKIALNAFSSAVMVRLHKVYGNLMVDMKATNAKLLRRTLALTVRACGCDEAAAAQMLQRCGQHVKLAIVALRAGVEPSVAQAWLDAAHGSVRAALDGRDAAAHRAP
ncbi:MAG: N-acetylmuramic acid 6-phosphate etherase [Rubrivivax sp.]|jgi:N-acetylmuramic acid 6-phosphate etherase|nr:N-acetylmuramic acid 6-phosphate etherase [Rubrivivax sp.]